MKSLRNLAPSLLLIAIYFIADEFFGPVAGLCTALVLGSAEFIYTRIQEKRYDKMVLWTTLFFCIPGLISIYAEGSVLHRLQPALIETALCLLLGIFAFSKTDIAATLPANCRKEVHFSAAQADAIRRMFRTLFYVLAVHTLFSYTALLFMPETVADFISSPLLYILVGAYFAVLFVRNWRMRAQMRREEWLPVVDEKGKVTGRAPRSVCHSGSKLLHPVVHLHIVNERHEIFLQKRSMKKSFLPGMWDTAVGGHVGIGEKLEDALKRETCEELGITDFEAAFLGSYIWESEREKELVFSFICKRYDHIHIDNDEVDEGRFWSIRDIQEGIQEKTLTPNFIHEYKLLFKEDKKKGVLPSGYAHPG